VLGDPVSEVAGRHAVVPLPDRGGRSTLGVVALAVRLAEPAASLFSALQVGAMPPLGVMPDEDRLAGRDVLEDLPLAGDRGVRRRRS
jgi:hypothetical protein